MVVCIVERQWIHAAAWSGVGALLSMTGLMHSYALNGRDTVISLPWMDWLNGQWKIGQPLFPAGGEAMGYALAAALFLLARFITVPRREGDVL
jgi:adenine/guanine/hypoxanthine permease